jgi:hypothetical protein
MQQIVVSPFNVDALADGWVTLQSFASSANTAFEDVTFNALKLLH